MTPEEVEQRLQSLQTPAPPERLRARCLAPRFPSARPRAMLAIAASFLVVALAVWLVTTSSPQKPPEKILPSPEPLSPFADDPVLKQKVDRLLRENPGKGVLVVRVKELRDGVFHPVTQGFSLQILLEDAREEPDPLVHPGGPRAGVDLDGTLLFVKSPGVFRGVGFSNDPDETLKKLCFVWEYKDITLNPGGVLLLSDAVFTPWVTWTSPAEGGSVSLKEDPRISWAPYPEIAELRIDLERVQIFADESISWSKLGTLKRGAPKDAGLPLSELLKACRLPVAPGYRLALNFSGCDRHGKELTRCKDKLQVVLKE